MMMWSTVVVMLVNASAGGQSEKIFNAASQRVRDFQCKYGRGNIHAILYGVDAFS